MDDLVYMTVSFYNVRRSEAEVILKAAMEAAGTVDVSVHYDEPFESE